MVDRDGLQKRVQRLTELPPATDAETLRVRLNDVMRVIREGL